MALENGCNDYVEKPFGVNELLARIRAVLRTFSGIDIPPTSYDHGQLKKEFDLLQEFISHPGRILTQQHLLKKIWGSHHAGDTHYLRDIETEAGVGYRFIGGVNTA